MPCSASDIIAPCALLHPAAPLLPQLLVLVLVLILVLPRSSIRTVAVGPDLALQVLNGSTIGCFVLNQAAGGDVVHEPDPAACKSRGDSARWKPTPTTGAGGRGSGAAAVVQLQSVQNASACLTAGNGTPTDFGARKVWAGPCGGGSGTWWVVDATGGTVAAFSEDLFEQPG